MATVADAWQDVRFGAPRGGHYDTKYGRGRDGLYNKYEGGSLKCYVCTLFKTQSSAAGLHGGSGGSGVHYRKGIKALIAVASPLLSNGEAKNLFHGATNKLRSFDEDVTMGQGCTKCSVGNPCTDPKCLQYGSRYLEGLVIQIREKFEDLQEAVGKDDRNQAWLENMDRNFEDRTALSADGFKYYAKNVRDYFNKPQPSIDDLDNIEYRLMICLDSHKEGEYMECTNYARELTKLATAGRDQPAHCREKPNPYKCTFDSTSTLVDAGATKGATEGAIDGKAKPFGSCYA